MTPFQDKLRTALRETADEIPPEAPPLLLTPQERTRRDPHPRWRAWATPLAAAALVVAVIAATVAIAAGMKHQQNTSAPVSLHGLPPYYVALTYPGTIHNGAATAVELRATATGAVLAKITPPRPYLVFTGVTGDADDRTFVLSAEGSATPPPNLPAAQFHKEFPHGAYDLERFFLLRIDPASASPGRRMSLTALPAGFTPAYTYIHDMALAPDGTMLAADVGGHLGTGQLYVFNLATGTERAWSVRTCAGCSPSSGGLVFGDVNADALSWTADGRHVAFVWRHTIRLLDTGGPGSNLLTDSQTVAAWPTPENVPTGYLWGGAVITPNGRTVLGIEIVFPQVGDVIEHLVRFSAATGRPTAIINSHALGQNYFEQVLYTNATGSVLVATALRPGPTATILDDGHSTSLPWSPDIGTAAW